MNIRRTAAFLLIASMLLALCGCNIIQVDEERDRAQVVATVDGQEIKKSEVLNLFDSYKSIYGITDEIEKNPTREQAESIKNIKLSLLDSLIEQKFIAYKVHEGGFDNYTDEQLKNVEAEIDDMINNYLESAREDAVERGEADPDKYAQEALEKLFADSDLSRQKLIDEQLVVEIGQENLREYSVKDVKADESEIEEKYASLLSEQQSYDTNSAAFQSDYLNGTTIVYAPANHAYYKHLLVVFTDEDKTAISDASGEKSDAQKKLDQTNEEIETLEEALDEAEDREKAEADIAELKEQAAQYEKELEEAQAAYDEAMKKGLENIHDKAAKLLDRVKAGEDFDKLIEEEGEDPGMEDEPAATTGYPIPDEGTSVMVEEFTKAAQSLKNVGDYTQELVSSEYGYSIILKAGLVEAGEKDLDTVRDIIEVDITLEKQGTAWENLLEQWIKDAKADKTIIVYDNRI